MARRQGRAASTSRTVRHRHARRWLPGLRLLVVLFVLAAAATAQAGLRELSDGEPLRLSAGEGVLALAVDSALPIEQVRVDGPGIGNGMRLDGVAAGRQIRWFAAPAGRYRWERVVERDDREYLLGADPEYAFSVVAGVINYPGDLVFRPRGGGRAVLHLANRGLGVLDRWRREHPGRELPFVYQGHYPDPFPAFYREQLGGNTPPRRAQVRGAEAVATLPISPDELWRQPAMQRVALSPDGRWLARHDQTGDCATIELLELATGRSQVLTEVEHPVHELGWAGDHRLVLGVGRSQSAQSVSIFDIGETPAAGSLSVDRLQIPRRGRVIDLLPSVADRLMFASRVDGQMAVHRLDIADQAALDGFGFDWAARLNHAFDGDLHWLTDGRGRLRAAQAADRHGANVLYHGRGDVFSEVLRVHDEHGFQPLRLSADGSLIYGLSEDRRTQRDLVALDPATGRIATMFQRPGIDVVAPVFDLDRTLIGASYVQSGRLVTEFFSPEQRLLDDQLRQAFPSRSIRLLDRDRDGRQLILAVAGSDLPEAIYHYDVASGAARLIQSSRPWLAQHRLAPSHVVRSRSVDGLEVESYLTLPEGDGRRALVVMPHGGPIGIRNLRQFEPEVQFLASLGYAVLQVNYRGSSGFGRGFREAGHGQLGGLIESDIDAAIAAALDLHPLDQQRICMLGASYGGYSAMVATLRWPGRFRCAVSISGFSDRVLQFTASDSGRSADVREILETFMGDPATDLDLMRATSPLYRYRELDVPLLLAHGTEDLRVDYEQTRRLVRMLNLAGRAPTLITLYGEGHSIEMAHNRDKLWRAIAGFLQRHLQPAVVDDGGVVTASR